MVFKQSNFRKSAGKVQKNKKNLVEDGEEMQTTMFKIRARDKFVVVKEAPWRVFDHIEIFLHPTEIKLTHHFYTQFKIFFFENNPLTNLEKSKAGTYSLFKTVKVLKKSVMGM